LLRIFLQPPPSSGSSASVLLDPALEFISRQGPRLDPQEAIKLLPPMVPAGALKKFLIEAVRQPIFDTRVVREVAKARKEGVERRLVALQERRVKVDDSRMCVIAFHASWARVEPLPPLPSRCPQCHKRIGAISVIAVHMPRYESTLTPPHVPYNISEERLHIINVAKHSPGDCEMELHCSKSQIYLQCSSYSI
jgi:Vam6/Vps39-like protein vacuolar protein sorting-associated protein 39